MPFNSQNKSYLKLPLYFLGSYYFIYVCCLDLLWVCLTVIMRVSYLSCNKEKNL